MHAAVFLLAAAWTLRDNAHVRVDIFYADAKPRRKAAIDLAGSLVLLLPFALAVLWLSVPYVSRSWTIFERSHESGGIPAVFVLKTLIPLFALTFALQGVSQAIRAAHVLRGEAA
jgi:TRAP-type mannitol/chloroaromatic compound transport system permease small subunit